MINNTLISVVVPVYNVEAYLKRCIESILNQIYDDIEIILIDDGSTDSSGKICDDYSNNSKIRVYHKANGGLSDARNHGIKMSKGQYVCFIDSDDWISPHMIKTLYDLLVKTKSDVSVCNMRKFSEVSEIQESFLNSYEVLSSEEALLKMIDYKCGFGPNACNKLYKKELFTKDCLYPVGKRYEDMIVTAKIIGKSNRIVYTCNEYYYYFQRNDSITNQKFNYKDLDHIDMSEELYKYISDKYNNIENEFLLYHLFNQLSCCNKIILSNAGDYSDVIIETKNEIKKNVKNILKSKVYSITKRTQLMAFAYSNCIYRMLYKGKKKYEKK